MLIVHHLGWFGVVHQRDILLGCRLWWREHSEKTNVVCLSLVGLMGGVRLFV
jgi:hypothetical protein